MNIPLLIRIRQRFDEPVLRDIPGDVARQVHRLGLGPKVKSGQSVAVACSSRGIANYLVIVEAIVRSLLDLGLKPFLIPAMGSHGAATAEGQKRVLEHLGLSENALGVPIQSSLDTVAIDETKDGIPVFLDKLASKADHIVIVNRVKPHTDFEAEIESGLMKMMAIGLGKRRGAAEYHEAVFRWGYPRVILGVGRKIIQSGRILFGVAIVENGYEQTATVSVLPPNEIEDREKQLLKDAKRLMLRLPFDDVDILIVDEIGKDISGTGMDTKVIGRIYLPLLTEEPQSPRIKRIVVCDLTERSEGNALGIGLADFVTKRLLDKVDWNATNVNAVIGGCPEHARLPLVLPSDREAVETAARSVGSAGPEQLKLIRIKNTKQLGEIDVSSAYRDEIMRRKDLEIVAEKSPLHFDEDGTLKPF